ncbi:uncharacterized protein EV420DRAFT_1528023 [Desarmillaria tabescens]|uniref:Uncharacterized protein n=1 Tax=Armillaria tabescens TaxID=1929756 RepID=A0AA39T3K1_ARMTA|nr:uncharacterized protein EV420DRAFT_1528023 [Desarmillaria tabescens]KAK0461951.1 hypothetical protein EV420DRAFT_1528023 [Desarmillaria tabescens]
MLRTNGVLAILPKLAAVLVLILGLKTSTLRCLEVIGDLSQRIDLQELHIITLASEIRSWHLLDRPGSKSRSQERVRRAQTTLPVLGPALPTKLTTTVVGVVVAVAVETGVKRRNIQSTIARTITRKNRWPIIIISHHHLHQNRRHPRQLAGEAGARKRNGFLSRTIMFVSLPKVLLPLSRRFRG